MGSLNVKKAANQGLRAAACIAVMAAALGTDAAEARTINQIQRYCHTSWRNARISPQDWTDCTQQTFAELLERIGRQRLGDAIGEPDSPDRRELNRAIWRVAQRWRRAPRTERLNGQTPELSVGAAVEDSSPESEALWKAIDGDAAGLTDRQRSVLRLFADGSTISEIAEVLDLPPARVSDEKYKAVQKLRQFFEPNANVQ